MSSIKEGCYKPRLYVSVNLLWSMEYHLAWLGHYHAYTPMSNTTSRVTKRKSIHGFRLFSYMGMAGLDISARPLAQASGKTDWQVQITDHSPSLASTIFISRILLKISVTFYIQFKIMYTVHKAISCSLLFETSHTPGFVARKHTEMASALWSLTWSTYLYTSYTAVKYTEPSTSRSRNAGKL